MSIDLLKQRPTYLRTGRVRLISLFFVMPIALMAAALMACCLWLLFEAGWYYYVIMPIVISLPVAAACYLTVKLSHCRNLGIAATMGLLIGLIFYLGYFHAHLVSMIGLRAIHRLDLLPDFIVWRMNNDVQIDDMGKERAPAPVMNWITFGMELLIVVCITTGASAQRASRAYCEGCKRWKRFALHTAPSGAAGQVAYCLGAGRLLELPIIPPIQAQVGTPSSSIKVEYCPTSKNKEVCHTYLTLQENATNARGKAARGATYLSGGEISQEELAVLVSSLSGLAPAAPGGVDVPMPSVAEPNTTASTQVANTTTAIGTVQSLPSRMADTVYTKKNTTVAACLSLFPIAAVLVGIGLLVLAWWYRPFPDADTLQVIVAISCLIIGVIAIVFGVVVCFVNVDYFNMRRGFRLAHNEISVRPDAIVNPNNPLAVYVEVVPRERWSTLLSDHPSDGGFLLVDETKREVLFEGAKQRYRIPGSAIQGCETECTIPNAGSFAFYATTLRAYVTEDAANAAGGANAVLWEAPFMVRPVAFTRFNGEFRRRTCEALRDQIQRIKTT